MSRVLLALPLLLLSLPAAAHEDDGDRDAAQDGVPDPGVRGHAEVHARRPKRSVAGDLSSKWFHVGGGFGGVGHGLRGGDAPTYGAGRFVLGSGGYTWFLYGGSEFAATHTPIEPIRVEGAGYVGIAIPVPVFHPLIGVRGSVGGHFTGDAFLPQLSVGPQAGFILRKFDGKPGLRLMVDAGANIRPIEQEVVPEVFVTLSGVF
jgi:hypothetical protein